MQLNFTEPFCVHTVSTTKWSCNFVNQLLLHDIVYTGNMIFGFAKVSTNNGYKSGIIALASITAQILLNEHAAYKRRGPGRK